MIGDAGYEFAVTDKRQDAEHRQPQLFLDLLRVGESVVQQLDDVDDRCSQGHEKRESDCKVDAQTWRIGGCGQRSEIDYRSALRLELRADADFIQLGDKAVILRPVGVDLALQDRVFDILVVEDDLLPLHLRELGLEIGFLVLCFLIFQPQRIGYRQHAVVVDSLEFLDLRLQLLHFRKTGLQDAQFLLILAGQIRQLFAKLLQTFAFQNRTEARPAAFFYPV
ncbi:hypothetical protein, partial [Mesorhizobium sp. M7A.F.Ca.CA.004.02.1.1]|uniref:hypothetical protein n=1 Tax=Mesorhizobium sp. M7A.F.Ca.CA.004.02.1.1 TaxID=2496690 RepID=UPI0032AFE77E